MNTGSDEESGAWRPTGALDIYNAETLRQSLAEHINAKATPCLDLAEVGICDTAGAQLLWSATKTAANEGKTIQFKQVPAVVRESCNRLGLPELF